jgi:uncharacterized protein (TIGR03118 family)
VAKFTDPNLINPWGIVLDTTGNIRVADNGTGLSTVYSVTDGSPTGTTVSTSTSSPTGVVANTTNKFKVTKSGNSQPATFIFVSEDGIITGWNSTLDATHAIVAVDNSAHDSIYKGAAISGNTLYATDFHNNKVEMYNGNFNRIDTATTFVDPNLPAGYAPFGIQTINGSIYVTYALQDADKEDDVSGPGHGYVDVYNTNGTFVKRLISGGNLNSPWGLQAGPSTFGKFNGGLYVGNFGDGVINVYNLSGGFFMGNLHNINDGSPVAFDGLWGLLFQGSDLYITAGIGDEDHGLFSEVFAAP